MQLASDIDRLGSLPGYRAAVVFQIRRRFLIFPGSASIQATFKS